MRASVVVNITQVVKTEKKSKFDKKNVFYDDFDFDSQELDKRWKISTETAIKAKSMRGYATYTRSFKMPLKWFIWVFFSQKCKTGS